MAARTEGNSNALAKLRARLDKHAARLSQLGIDPERLLTEEITAYERDGQERAAAVWKRMCADAALILSGGVPDSCLVVCRMCGERKSILTDFYCFHDPNGKPVRTRICKSCCRDEQRRYADRDKEVNALRRRLADIERSTIRCTRCQEKKPRVAFPSDARVCLQCRVEIVQSLLQSLRERLACDEGASRISLCRNQARGEYAGKRLQRAINQSDGTLSVEVVGRLFGEAEGKPCPYCGKYMSRATKSLDHMVPLSRGGVHGVVNLIICCKRCNSAKRDLDFADWISRLNEPHASMMVAEYEQRYGAKPSQSRLPLQYVPVSTSAAIQ